MVTETLEGCWIPSTQTRMKLTAMILQFDCMKLSLLFRAAVSYSLFFRVFISLRPVELRRWSWLCRVFWAGPRRGALAGVGVLCFNRTARIPFLYLLCM